jgi:N-acetylmuramoyl-L-alanine amidase
VALKVSQRLRQVLVARGATVVLTRDADVDLGLKARMDRIQAEEPTLALSLHYNALPDQGDAIGTQGVAAFWYHDQAQGLAQSLHDALVKDLKRSSYGVFWNNLALTRPAIAPTVMLELGFMINPDEFEWIVDDQAQERLVQALANGIEDWVRRSV